MRTEVLTVVSISVFWLVAQCNGVDCINFLNTKNAVSMFKAEEFDSENGGIIFFRGVGTQLIIEFVSIQKHCVMRENVSKCCRKEQRKISINLIYDNQYHHPTDTSIATGKKRRRGYVPPLPFTVVHVHDSEVT